MTDTTAISDFFAGWAEATADGRRSKILPAISDSFHYADPHAPAPITSGDAFLDFVAAFTQNAPGASITVVHPIDAHNGHFRCTVRFEMGPEMTMTGQYFGDLDEAGKISRLVGFIGKGPE